MPAAARALVLALWPLAAKADLARGAVPRVQPTALRRLQAYQSSTGDQGLQPPALPIQAVPPLPTAARPQVAMPSLLVTTLPSGAVPTGVDTTTAPAAIQPPAPVVAVDPTEPPPPPPPAQPALPTAAPAALQPTALPAATQTGAAASPLVPGTPQAVFPATTAVPTGVRETIPPLHEPVTVGPLEHPALDCWAPCGQKAGYCSWCGQGNSCCKRGEASDPTECATASVYLSLHHECVQTLSPGATLPAPTAPTATAGETSAPTSPPGPPTVVPPPPLPPAGEALLSTVAPTAGDRSPQAPVTLPPTSLPDSASPAQATDAGVSTTVSATRANEIYADRRDRFIRGVGGSHTYFQDAQTLTRHLVRAGCKACGSPPPCEIWLSVSEAYIQNLTLGEDFQCDMLEDPSPHNYRAVPFPTTTVLPGHTTTTTTTTHAAGGVSGWTWLLCGLLALCCCGAAAGAVLFAMKGGGKGKGKGRKAAQKGKKTRVGGGRVVHDDSSSNSNGEEDQVPLVLGQEDGMSRNSFGSQTGELGQREAMAAMAPTYTAMTPQMGQAQMAAQMQMQMQAQMPTQTNLQPPMTQQALPGTYRALQTQAAFAPQEMELVTVTPNGLAVTPLAPGQPVPEGVPVLGQPGGQPMV